MKIILNVTGHEMEAEYSGREIEEVFLPLLEKINKEREKKESRLIVYLAAPPGTGKTTLSLFLEHLYRQRPFPYSFQSIPMDGFHHTKNYLLTHRIEVGGEWIPLNNVKGSPESFDLESLRHKLEQLQEHPVDWPLYDRNLHDVSEETLWVDADIVLIEGNWLLLDEEGWSDLMEYCDFSVFVEAEERLLRPRLIERKMRGGLPLEEAELFYEASDRKNVFRVLDHSHTPDWRLKVSDTGKWFQ